MEARSLPSLSLPSAFQVNKINLKKKKKKKFRVGIVAQRVKPQLETPALHIGQNLGSSPDLTPNAIFLLMPTP